MQRAMLNQCEEMAGKSLIEIMIYIHFERDLSNADNKRELISYINNEISSNYNVNHLNNYISNRKPLPKTIQSLARRDCLRYLFGDEVAEMLKGIY